MSFFQNLIRFSVKSGSTKSSMSILNNNLVYSSLGTLEIVILCSLCSSVNSFPAGTFGGSL